MDNPACNYHMITTRYAPENTTLTAKKKEQKEKQQSSTNTTQKGLFT
jgi:hypothetical protein